MGKWAEIQCACPNRVRLPCSDFYLDRPHRKKQRLTKREKAEVQEWERTTENMFACGHQRGVVLEFAPDDMIRLGYHLNRLFPASTFQVFAKVGDWRCYDDELLLIHPEEAKLWLLEIEEIQTAFQGSSNLTQNKF
jgi:hypothetical protein